MPDKSAVENAAAVVAKLKEYSERATDATERAIKKAALLVERDAKRACPVNKLPGKGGYLRASITNQLEGAGTAHPTATVGTNTHYAPHVEYGTKHMTAQPYLRPAYEQNKDEIERLIKEAVKSS